MKQRTDNERLLADVLDAEADAGFSATVLAETLRGVRQRQSVRQFRRVGGALLVLLALAFVAGHLLRRGVKPELARSPQPTSYQLVISQPLASDQIVSTQPLAPEQRVVSETAALVVQTTVGGFREVGDDELMAMAAPNVVALVRRGPHEAELVFVSAPLENSDARQN
jgi:hypothetical protein